MQKKQEISNPSKIKRSGQRSGQEKIDNFLKTEMSIKTNKSEANFSENFL